MRGPSVQVSDDDEVVDLHKSTSFQIPRPSPPSGASGPSLGTDMLINRRKVSNEVMSLSSSSREGSEYSDSAPNSPQRRAPSPQYQQRPASSAYRQPPPPQQQYSFGGNQVQSSSDDESESEEENVGNNGYGGNAGGGGGDAFGDRFRAERSRLESEMEEKKEILYQMDRLESKGYKLPRNFSMQSDLEEMRAEYHRIVREKEIDASIRFQRKALMFLVSGVEFMNTRFDPIAAKLDGWSETVHDKINDYDDIFEELHEKYKGSGQKMAPELRLLMGVGGSAFMYHLAQSMFKQSKTTLPGVEEVLRSNPELMKQFQNAALNQMQQQEAAEQKQQQASGGGMGGGIFGMLGNMMNLSGLASGGGPGGSMPMPQMTRPGKPVRSSDDIDDIINNIHEEIITSPNEVRATGRQSPRRQVETMSVSDEEITSIIEDTADLNGILMNNAPRGRGRPPGIKRPGGGRTMNL